jgi:hypothetical protein
LEVSQLVVSRLTYVPMRTFWCALLHLSFEIFFQCHCVNVFCIVRAVDQRNRTILSGLKDGLSCADLLVQFSKVSTAGLIPFFWDRAQISDAVMHWAQPVSPKRQGAVGPSSPREATIFLSKSV